MFNFNEASHRQAAHATWRRKNNLGGGFGVGPEHISRLGINTLGLGTLEHKASHRYGDDLAIYRKGSTYTLVAWQPEGAWAVRATEAEIDAELQPRRV